MSYQPFPRKRKYQQVSGGAFGIAEGGAKGYPIVIDQTLVTLRNDFDGCIGFIFTVGSNNITVNALGRWIVSGNVQGHLLKIVDSLGALIVSATLQTINKPIGDYAYINIPQTLLLANTTYVMLSEEFNGGDQWYNNDTSIIYTNLITTVKSEIQVGCAGALSGGGFSDTSFVPVNFKTTNQGIFIPIPVESFLAIDNEELLFVDNETIDYIS